MSEGQPEVRAEKARLRAQFRAARAAYTDEARAAASAAIVARMLALPEVAAARAAHVFWPLAARREVDVRPLVEALVARGARVALPVVASEPGEPPRMLQRLYTGADALVPDRRGLLEPTGALVAPSALDLVVAPALGAGRDGYRVGYGGGFYDAFLAGLRAPVVCPLFAACLVEAVPVEPHDRPVDVVVTEHEVVRVGGGPPPAETRAETR